MKFSDDIPITNLDPRKPNDTTESGELERPVLRRRRIDCAGGNEVSDRRATRGGGRREMDPREMPTAG